MTDKTTKGHILQIRLNNGRIATELQHWTQSRLTLKTALSETTDGNWILQVQSPTPEEAKKIKRHYASIKGAIKVGTAVDKAGNYVATGFDRAVRGVGATVPPVVGATVGILGAGAQGVLGMLAGTGNAARRGYQQFKKDVRANPDIQEFRSHVSNDEFPDDFTVIEGQISK